MAMRLAITSLARVAEYLGALRIASWIPGADHPARSFASRVVSDAAAVREYPGYEFFLCGHTHHAEAVVLDTGPKGPGPRTYINCGTWGVVHQYAGTGLDSAQRPHRQFSSWQETSYATIHTPAEQAEGNPPFALFRQTEATTGFRVLDS